MSNTIKYESMDEGDVRFYLKDANIIQYRSLVGYTMQKLLPRNKSYVIIHYPVSSENQGHWVVITRFNRTFEYFDSYGGKPDDPFSWPTSNFKWYPHYLSSMFRRTKMKVVYNTTAFQTKKNLNVSTCGAYVVFRVLTMLEMNASMQKNNQMLEHLHKTTGQSYDDIVVNYINKR